MKTKIVEMTAWNALLCVLFYVGIFACGLSLGRSYLNV